MRRSLHLAGLSALCAAFLLAGVPIAPCQQPTACPMLEALLAAGGERCDPGPSIDCCAHDRPLPGLSSELAEAGQPAAAAAFPAPRAAALAPPPPRPRAASPAGAAARPVPLYTLLATLLI